MLPPAVGDYVSESDLAVFVRDLVRNELELEAIKACCSGVHGRPAHDPAMMTALILHARCRGLGSSREIAQACRERMDFMALTGGQTPDFRTADRFRSRHPGELAGLFDQVVGRCLEAGLASLRHVALDGTRIHANASKHKAMSYGRMAKAEASLAADIGELRASGKPPPDLLAEKERRLERIQKARKDLEARARAEAGAKGGEPSSAVPEAKAQRNFTDPESRMMWASNGCIQGYNAQAAADADNQIIVAHGLTADGSDRKQLAPMVEAIAASTSRLPKELSADAGCCSEANLELLKDKGIRGYVATGRQRHGTPAAAGGKPARKASLRADMRRRLKQGGRNSRYRLRKITIEPVFGQIKQGRRFRRFLLRGLDKVRQEWALACTAHNLVKLFTALMKPKAAARPRMRAGNETPGAQLSTLDASLFGTRS